MQYFVIVYNRRSGEVDIKQVFDSARRSEAMRVRFKLEKNYRQRPELEVVVLGAESKAALSQTHSRYFRSSADLIQRSRQAYA